MFDIFFSSKILANMAVCKFELRKVNVCSYLCIVIDIFHWYEGYVPVFLGRVMHDETETMENNIYTKDKIKPQHVHLMSNKHMIRDMNRNANQNTAIVVSTDQH